MGPAYAVQMRERRVSVRLMWPFLRVLPTGPSPVAMRLLGDAGIGPADLARPDTRLPHRLFIDLLDAWVSHTGDDTIGLRAGASVEPGDFDTFEHAARSCSTLGNALDCASRYVHLLNEAADISIVMCGDRALWRYRVTDGVPLPRAANDFLIVLAARFSRRCAPIEPAREIHFMHQAPTDVSGYAAFSRSTLRFGMAHNGFVIERSQLDLPSLNANAPMHDAFESYARELSRGAARNVCSRARDVIAARIGNGEMCMEVVAMSLAMSVPTLRRRLEDEGTTFTQLVDDLRRDLAERYLRDSQRSIGEIASLLGFAHAPAFHKAFRRWKGVTPSAHRARIWGGVPSH
jgi:AraC-like DNA-binding protein